MARLCPFEMDPQKQKELFCCAYIDAIVSAAGYTLETTWKNDDDSIDAQVKARRGPGPLLSPRLEIQFKSTSSPSFDKSRRFIRYKLKQKNYDDLIGKYCTARIIALLVLPPDVNHWVGMSEDCLTLYRGCYWRSLKDLPSRANNRSTTILFPRENLLTAEVLDATMLAIARGEAP